MSKSLELLNAVNKMMVKFANEKGIDLQADFETPEKFKHFVIGFTIKTLVEMGLEISEAYDIALGEGAYKKTSDSVWDSLQKV